jgi:hypothetical protein
MLFEEATATLGWPERQEVFAPRCVSKRVQVETAKAKIETPLKRLGADISVGLLASNPNEEKTEAPLAIVCDFGQSASDTQLDAAQQLAWNFCRSRLLITLERHRLRAWTCCLPPTSSIHDRIVFDDTTNLPDATLFPISESALHALHWISLSSGEFFERRKPSFRSEGRVDALLLDNLREVRRRLIESQLPKSISHDLLARLIFVQFLFQRQDSQGKPFLDERLLKGRLDGKLSQEYSSLSDILGNYTDSYILFQWLNDRFNGDLFPGKGKTPEEREQEWNEEKAHVKPEHLKLLASFTSGQLDLRHQQPMLWRFYSFDTIPLEFISSVYEQFVSDDAHSKKAYYTKSFLVDYMLDNVLPWDGQEWDIKILDPSCGSGIFLVKAFLRLIQRWKNAHPGQEPGITDLKPILSKSLFGVDIDPEAVRVASFSLYLAMCDAIDPRHYWKQTVFPRLREQNLIAQDFFRDDTPGFRTNEDSGTFDLVVGNAPWGKNSINDSTCCRKWANANEWPISYNDIGPLFLAKSSKLAKKDGWVSLLQPANTILFNRSAPAITLREAFFNRLRIAEITNLSSLRFVLFAKAIGPACAITYQNRKPDPDGKVVYLCPKATGTSDDFFRIIIEPNDINEVPYRAAIDGHFSWTTLTWGGWRDYELIASLRQRLNLAKLKSKGVVFTSEGIIRGNREQHIQDLIGMRLLSESGFPEDSFLTVNAADLPINEDPLVHSAASNDLAPFQIPQLIIKQSWIAKPGRFRAVMVNGGPDDAVVCSDSYVSVHVEPQNESILHAACLVFNSKLATYFQLLTSGQFATFIPKPIESELRRVPLPEPKAGLLEGLTSFDDVDERVRQLFQFKPAEWALIEDVFNFTLPFFKRHANSPGRHPTPRKVGKDPDLKSYAEQFIRVLRSGFGKDKEPRATIFQETGSNKLPVRLLAIHLHWPGEEKSIQLESIGSDKLAERLISFYSDLLQPSPNAAGVLFERHARVYTVHEAHGVRVPTIFFIKPDQRRHWTRSQAMRDADEVVNEILKRPWPCQEAQ